MRPCDSVYLITRGLLRPRCGSLLRNFGRPDRSATGASRTYLIKHAHTSILSLKRHYYTPSPPQKQAARKLSQWKQDSAARNRYYRGTCKTLQIREGQRPRCPRFAAVRATRTLPLPGFASVSIIFALATSRRSRFRHDHSPIKHTSPTLEAQGLQ